MKHICVTMYRRSVYTIYRERDSSRPLQVYTQRHSTSLYIYIYLVLYLYTGTLKKDAGTNSRKTKCSNVQADKSVTATSRLTPPQRSGRRELRRRGVYGEGVAAYGMPQLREGGLLYNMQRANGRRGETRLPGRSVSSSFSSWGFL